MAISALADRDSKRKQQSDFARFIFSVADWAPRKQHPFQTWHVATEVPGMSAESPEVNRRILRRPEVEARCGFKRAHLYKLIGEGKFPRPLRIGIRAVGWDSIEIEQWIAEQLQRRI